MIDRKAHKDEEPDYLSYLLRLWCVEGDKGRVWRASLQSTRTRQQVGFAGLEALFEYLRTQTGGEAALDHPRFRKSRKTSEIYGKSMNRERKGGADANSVDPEPANL